MSQTTTHGENIAGDIQGEDAYGYFNPLTAADLWNIADNLHTHFLDYRRFDLCAILEATMRQLEQIDEELPL